jgi:hypothetical protein
VPSLSADDALVAPRTAQLPPSPEGVWDDPPEVEPEPEPDGDSKIKEFDPRHREPFLGLLYVGYLETDVMIYGHKFRLRTPSQTDRLQIGLIIKPWRDTAAEEIAWQQAMVASYLITLDGQPLPMSVLNGPDASDMRDRFNWIGNNLKQPVLNRLFEECLILESEVENVLEAMGKA